MIDGKYIHCENGKPSLVDKKEMPMNICIKSARFFSDKESLQYSTMVTWSDDIIANFYSNNLGLLTINSILGLVLLITTGNDLSYHKNLLPFYVHQTYYKKMLS